METKSVYIEIEAPEDLRDDEILEAIQLATAMRAAEDPRTISLKVRSVVSANGIVRTYRRLPAPER